MVQARVGKGNAGPRIVGGSRPGEPCRECRHRAPAGNLSAAINHLAADDRSGQTLYNDDLYQVVSSLEFFGGNLDEIPAHSRFLCRS